MGWKESIPRLLRADLHRRPCVFAQGRLPDMHRSTRRLLWLVAGLLLFLIASALLYQVGMARLEGKPRTFWDSFEWAAETLSTTGYGFDSHWRHPAMVVLVVVVQFAGVFLVFL